MVWNLPSRSRVRVMTCISCKSLRRLGFYSLTWTYKIHFSKIKFLQIQKKVYENIECMATNWIYFFFGISSNLLRSRQWCVEIGIKLILWVPWDGKRYLWDWNTIETTDLWIPNTLFAWEMSRVFFLFYFY
jgi:hypothetical protein